MPRASRNRRARHKRVLKEAKGYRGARGKLYKTAVQAVDRAGCYAYRDRKRRKIDFRRLWIVRINAAARQNEISYSQFINGLKKANIQIDRKILAHMAVEEPGDFSKIAAIAKEHL